MNKNPKAVYLFFFLGVAILFGFSYWQTSTRHPMAPPTHWTPGVIEFLIAEGFILGIFFFGNAVFLLRNRSKLRQLLKDQLPHSWVSIYRPANPWTTRSLYRRYLWSAQDEDNEEVRRLKSSIRLSTLTFIAPIVLTVVNVWYFFHIGVLTPYTPQHTPKPMIHSPTHVAYDVTQDGFRYGWLIEMGLPFLALMVLFQIIKWKWPTFYWDRLRFFFAVAMMIFWACLCSLGVTYNQYKGMLTGLMTNTCKMVEGKVENFYAYSNYLGRGESFTVQGRYFSYEDWDLHSGFHTTQANGGPIREGLRVRIYFVSTSRTYGVEDIAKLEILNITH